MRIGPANKIPRSASHYAEDLAYIHNAGYSGYIEGIAPKVLGLLKQAGIHDGPVVDVGCGGGLWVKHLTDAGYDAIGLDISPAMIALARKHAPDAKFHIGSLWNVQFPKCQAVTALGEVFCYLADQEASRRKLKSVLKRIFAALEPGGLLIFDVAEIGLCENQQQAFAEGDDWACLVRFQHDGKKEQLTRHITTFRKQGKIYRRSTERHIVQLYRGRELAVWLRGIGFRVRAVRRIDSQPMLPKRIGFVARKPMS